MVSDSLLLRVAVARACVIVCLLGGVSAAHAVVHSSVSFASPQSFAGSFPYPVGLAVGDIDGDGWPDVVASANLPERILWYRNLGNGTFATGETVATTTSGFFSNVALGDLNLDGRLDVLHWSNASIRWTPNLGGSNPAAQFGYSAANPAGNQFTVGATGVPETTVAVGDLNNDGRPDVLSATVTDAAPDNTVAWIANLSTGFSPRVVVSTAGVSPTSVRAVDFDNDGWRDLLVTSSADSTVAWFRNLGGGNFGSPASNRRVITTSMTVAQDAAAGDLNGDGFPDVVACGVVSSSVRWYAHNGSAVSPVIGPTGNVVTNGLAGAYSVALRDMDLDGWLDVLVAASNGGRIFWCANLGGGNFGDPASNQRTIAALARPTAMGVADFDGSGTPDVVGAAVDGATLNFVRHDGGQAAFSTTNTAPVSIIEGRPDDLLAIAVSHRGIAGDSEVALDSFSLLLESSAGVPLNSAQANALIDKLVVHLDADSSGLFDPAQDPAIATLPDLTLSAGGLLTFSFAGSVPAQVRVSPGATRTYFVVAKMSATATAQLPMTLRITHRSSGVNRSRLRDANTSAVLTIEAAGSGNVSSSVVAAAAQSYSYTDWSYLHYDSAGTPGTGPLDTPRQDGVPNLLKFGFGIDPLVPGASLQLPAMLRAGAARVFRHRRPAQSSGITYQYDIAREMGNWEAAVAGVHYTMQETAIGGGLIQRDLTVLGPWTRSFMSVRVVLAP